MMLEQEFLKNIESNQGILYKIINLYTDNDEDKKDLYQEIVYQGWKSYKNFRGHSKFSTWLYRIGLNVSLTYLSKQKKKSDLIDHLPVEYVAEQRELSDQSDKLQRAIKMLTEIDRGLIMLHLDGYSNMEISELAGISKVNTGVKLHRIKQHLTEILKS